MHRVVNGQRRFPLLYHSGNEKARHMALKPCRECKAEISTEAKTCPKCGAPNPTGSNTLLNATAPQPNVPSQQRRLGQFQQRAGDPPSRQRATGSGCLGVIVVFAVIVAVAILLDSNKSAPQGCRADWKQCKDNSDLVNNYDERFEAKSACQTSANSMAKFGSPVWPWLSFSTFLKGTDYVKTGVAVLIEPDAQFANGFGAMRHVQVRCTYDLNNKKVIAVNVD